MHRDKFRAVRHPLLFLVIARAFQCPFQGDWIRDFVDGHEQTDLQGLAEIRGGVENQRTGRAVFVFALLRNDVDDAEAFLQVALAEHVAHGPVELFALPYTDFLDFLQRRRRGVRAFVADDFLQFRIDSGGIRPQHVNEIFHDVAIQLEPFLLGGLLDAGRHVRLPVAVHLVRLRQKHDFAMG